MINILVTRYLCQQGKKGVRGCSLVAEELIRLHHNSWAPYPFHFYALASTNTTNTGVQGLSWCFVFSAEVREKVVEGREGEVEEGDGGEALAGGRFERGTRDLRVAVVRKHSLLLQRKLAYRRKRKKRSDACAKKRRRKNACAWRKR